MRKRMVRITGGVKMTTDTPGAVDRWFDEQNYMPISDTDHLTIFIENNSLDIDGGIFVIIKPEWVGGGN